MEELPVDRCLFSCGGEQLAVCGADGEVKIWETKNKTLTQRFRPGEAGITCAAWSKPQNQVWQHLSTQKTMLSELYT